MHSCPCAHCLAAGQVAKLPLSLSGRLPSWASPFLRRLANASGRIEFIIFLIMDWSFASGCSPPRPSATQLPSATDSQCSVRWGLSPHCWCALSGARGSRRRRADAFGSAHGRRLFSNRLLWITDASRLPEPVRCQSLGLRETINGIDNSGLSQLWLLVPFAPFRTRKRLHRQLLLLGR